MVGKKAVLMFVLLSLGLVAATFHPAQSKLSATINFSGFAEGAIVSSLSVGAGISGDPIEGYVSVFGSSPDFPGTNAAMIFDANCTDGCTGGDDDLDFSRYNLGPVLIISEDLDSNDPDDADHPGAHFTFDFKFGEKVKVTVKSLTVGDVEADEGGMIHVFGNGGEKVVTFNETGDNEIGVIPVNGVNVSKIVVDLNGSGIIDNIEIEVEEDNGPDEIKITLDGECHPQFTNTNNMKFWGTLTRNGNGIKDHTITLSLPNGKEIDKTTNDDGYYEYIFEGAREYIDKGEVKAEAKVDGRKYYSEPHLIKTLPDFENCLVSAPKLTIEGTCVPKGEYSEKLELNGTLWDADGILVPNHPIQLYVGDKDGNITRPLTEDNELTTDKDGHYEYIFVGAKQHLDTRVLAQTTLGEELVKGLYEKKEELGYLITAAAFEACQDEPKQYECHNVKLFTFHGQPIELGSQIPGWGLVGTDIECIGRGQGKSCRLVVKGQPGYVQKSDTLIIEKVPRLEPYVQYQAQIKGYDGAWTNKGCEFSFITGGRVASVSTHLADQVDPLGWVYLGQGRNAIKPLGVCSGWSDGCLFADNIIGFHFDDIYGNPLPGSELAGMQPGDRISIYRDHRLYTYEFTGSERVRQSAEGNQAILDAAEQHDLVLTTCSGYRLINAGQFSYTRYATFQLLPRVEPQHQWQ